MKRKKRFAGFLAVLCTVAIGLASLSGYVPAAENGTVSEGTQIREASSSPESTAPEIVETSSEITVPEVQEASSEITVPEVQEASSESTVETSEQKTAGNGIPVNDEGLPENGLLIKMVRDDASDDVQDPVLFVKLNPCGNKDHNTQPDNYMSSALICAEYIFERDEGDTAYHIVDQSENTESDRVRTSAEVQDDDYAEMIIESYSDTNDLWHSFQIQPAEEGTDRVYAFVPLGVEDNICTGASEQYCFQYEAALADEQNWEMSDGSRISGGYIVAGPQGSAEHTGSQKEERAIHLKRKTGGKEILLPTSLDKTVTENSLPDAGLWIYVNSLPENGMPDDLTLHLSCPEEMKNGEGGFGFSSVSEYRTSTTQKWMYQITGKGGMRVLIRNFRKTRKKYKAVSKKVVEVPCGGTVFDLNELNLEAGDRISVLPYTLNWGSNADTSEISDRALRPMRFFYFQYSLSCETSTLSASEETEDTVIRTPDAQNVQGVNPVSDGAVSLQKISLSVTGNDSDSLCGRQEDCNLPNYGLIVRKKDGESWESLWPCVTVIPQKDSGESGIWYAAQWFRKTEGTYTQTYVEKAYITESATVVCGGTDTRKQNADLCVIRRICYGTEEDTPTNNVFQWLSEGQLELTGTDGSIRYPQSGQDIFEFYPYGKKEPTDAGTVTLTACSIWHTADPSGWDSDPDESGVDEDVLKGIRIETDLSDPEQRARAVRADGEEDTVVLKNNTASENGLPLHSLVIMNQTVGATDETGVEYNVQLEMPLGIRSYAEKITTSSGSENAVEYVRAENAQKAACHVYRKKEDGTWEMIEQNDSSDWVNSGTDTFRRIDLSDSYSYGVHAHLKNNEAIVISPEIDFYDISYSVDMYSHETYDVLPDQCVVPSNCTHLTRHYFKGRFANGDTSSEGQNVFLIIATAKKNADEGGSEQASPLPEEKVRSLKVNLFDYDFGTEHDFVLGDQNQLFRFRYDPKNVQDADINMWHRGVFEGIQGGTLTEENQPVFTASTPFDEKGAGLFDFVNVSEKTNGGTKQVYPNVDFDFIYNAEDESYSYNSGLNAACFDRDTNHVTEYDRTLGIDGWDEKGAGFFPFNNFSQEGVWGTQDKKNKGTYLISKENGIDYHFGMSTTQTFQIPENGTINGKNMKFHFSGDDDAWVFIDGQLVLDMGGIHEAVEGYIDFTDGTWYVSADQTSPWDTFGTTYAAPKVSFGNLSDKISGFPADGIGGSNGTWAKGTKHTFTFFYLERGGTLSDLSMNFNLPTVKEEPTVTPVPEETPTPSVTPTPDEPETALIETGENGIYGAQIIGMICVLAAAGHMMRKRKRF